MKIGATLQMAEAALRSNRLRTALTALGVIIGVGAVVTMMAVGKGAQVRVAEQIRSLGSNLIIVMSGSITSGGVRLGSGSLLTITEDDARAIQRDVPSVEAAAPTEAGTTATAAARELCGVVIARPPPRSVPSTVISKMGDAARAVIPGAVQVSLPANSARIAA